MCDVSGRIRLLVEVKHLRELTADNASEYRSWHLEHHPDHVAFMLVTPARAFLWSSGAPVSALPELTLDMQHELRPYFERTGISSQDVRSGTFELLVSWWLGDILDGEVQQEETHRRLEQIGVSSLRGGQLLVEDAA